MTGLFSFNPDRLSSAQGFANRRDLHYAAFVLETDRANPLTDG
jgi:hypothetical protein